MIQAAHQSESRLAKYSARVACRRANFCHEITTSLVSRYAAIGIEDLNINALARGMLAKDVTDTAWARIIAMLTYKAARAGSVIIQVDPRGTS